MIPNDIRFKGVRFYEIHLPNLFKFYIKMDQQKLHPDIVEGSLEFKPYMPIFNRGSYEDSYEYKMLMNMRRQATEEKAVNKHSL